MARAIVVRERMRAEIIIVHHDRAVRKYLETACSLHHRCASADGVEAGLKLILRSNPAAALVGLDAKKKEALALLRYLKGHGSQVPVIVIAGRGGALLQPAAMKAGAKGFVEFPVDQALLDREISRVLQAGTDTHQAIPPVTEEELRANLSDLEKRLNRHMKCPSGKNQVHVQSLIIGLQKTKPRISLKCPLRARYNMQANVYYEYIRDICCQDPSACPAVQQFQARDSA